MSVQYFSVLEAVRRLNYRKKLPNFLQRLYESLMEIYVRLMTDDYIIRLSFNVVRCLSQYGEIFLSDIQEFQLNMDTKVRGIKGHTCCCFNKGTVGYYVSNNNNYQMC